MEAGELPAAILSTLEYLPTWLLSFWVIAGAIGRLAKAFHPWYASHLEYRKYLRSLQNNIDSPKAVGSDKEKPDECSTSKKKKKKNKKNKKKRK